MEERIAEYIKELKAEVRTLDEIINASINSGIEPSMMDIARYNTIRKTIKRLEVIYEEERQR